MVYSLIHMLLSADYSFSGCIKSGKLRRKAGQPIFSRLYGSLIKVWRPKCGPLKSSQGIYIYIILCPAFSCIYSFQLCPYVRNNHHVSSVLAFFKITRLVRHFWTYFHNSILIVSIRNTFTLADLKKSISDFNFELIKIK